MASQENSTKYTKNLHRSFSNSSKRTKEEGIKSVGIPKDISHFYVALIRLHPVIPDMVPVKNVIGIQSHPKRQEDHRKDGQRRADRTPADKQDRHNQDDAENQEDIHEAKLMEEVKNE